MSSSEFATKNSDEFAQFRQDWQQPASAPLQSTPIEPSPPLLQTLEAPSPQAPTPVAHHGTPLQGPESLLPDPVTHQSDLEPVLNPLSNVSEGIGYLKEVGLDYGYGPSGVMQTVLEWLHIYGGIPWYGSAVITAILIRAAFVRMQVKNSHSTARMMELKPLTDPIQEQLTEARAQGNQFAIAKLQKEFNVIRQEADLKIHRIFVPMIGAGVLSFGAWRNLRGMAELPIPALETEQFLWISDFSVADPTYALALVQPVLMYWNMRVSP